MFQRRILERIKTRFVFNKFFPPRKSYRLWDNVEKYFRAGQATGTIWRMSIACWIHKATNTFSENVALIAFALQQWLHERASMSRYTYIGCLVTTWRLCCFRQLTVMAVLGQGQDKPGTICAPAWDPNHSGRPRRGVFFIFVSKIFCV